MMLYQGKRTAICCGDQKTTYSELIQKVHMFSSKIADSKGFAIIYSENRIGWIYAFYAAWIKGLIPVPVDFMSLKKDLNYIIKDCKPVAIIYSSAKKAVVIDALVDSGVNPQQIEIDEIENLPAKSYSEIFDFKPDNQQTAVIIYTSGTTGSPKGVMLSFENLIVNMKGVTEDVPIYKPEDHVLVLLPLHHIFPLLGTMLMPLSIGSLIAISPSMASDDIIKTLQDNKVTIFIGVPRLYAAIRKGVKDKIQKSGVARFLFNVAQNLNSPTFSKFIFGAVHRKFGGSIKYFVSGGAALDPEIARDYRTLGFDILEGYGMTEAAPMITFTRPKKMVLGSAGVALSCCNIKIVDDEVVVSGINIMKGYLGRPEETAEVLKDGWLYTGDLGRLDKNGNLFITGRRKEIIVLSNGKNINPVEIENLLEAIHPVVKEVGVYQDGDRLRAVVVPNEQIVQEQKIENLEQFLKWNVLNIYNKEVVPYKLVTNIIVSNNELPRTRLGKLQRFLLPQIAKPVAKAVKTDNQTYSEEFNIIQTFLLEESKLEIRPEDHIEMDLGLDSLDKVSLQVFLETTFGMKLEISEIIGFGSVQKLCDHIAGNKTRSIVEKINWAEILRQKFHTKLPSTWITNNIIVKSFKIFFWIYFRFRGRGLENIPNVPCIIVPNHQSFFDGLFVASFLGFKRVHKTFFYAKEKHVRNAFVKFMANRNNVIVVDLNTNLKESIQKLAEVLKKQKNLVIFPEGTRSIDGTLGDFKKTFAILARELNVPVVPVSISGAYKALPKGSFFPRPFHKISVEFLKPIYPENHTYDTLSDMVRLNIEQNLV